MAESKEIRYTEAEREYYDAVIEERAQEMARDPDVLIEDVVKKDDSNEILHLRFRRDLERRVAELKVGQKSDAEKGAIEEFEGYVKTAEGKYLPKGLDEKFKVRVPVSARVRDLWRVSVIFRRVFGQTVDADKFDEIIKNAEKEAAEIREMQRYLDLLRLERKSAGEILTMCEEPGFMPKLKAARDVLKGVTVDPVKFMWTRGKIQRKEKDLPKRLKDRDKTLAAVEKLRAKRKAIFDVKFKTRLQDIENRRSKMASGEYKKQIEELRQEVKKFGEQRGYPMENFLAEELGENIPNRPAAEQETNLETMRKRSLFSRFWHEIAGTSLPDADLDKFITSLNTQRYRKTYEAIIKNNAGDIVSVAKFFFQGEYGKYAKLEESRRAKPTPEVMLALLRFIPEYADTPEDILELTFMEFAGDNYKNYNASDFDQFFDKLHAQAVEAAKEPKQKAA
jgi:hypothetical protein